MPNEIRHDDVITLELDAEAEARRQEIERCKREGLQAPTSSTKEREAARYKWKRENKICYTCDQPAAPGKVKCQACSDKYNEQQRLKYARKR